MSHQPLEARERPFDWSASRLLPPRVWIPLLAVLIVDISVAVFVEWNAGDDADWWSRAGLIVLAGVNVVLLIIVARLFISEALTHERQRAAAEREARELEKVVEARTRELSALSTHLQAFAEKEKSELAHNLHDELGGLLTAAKMDLPGCRAASPINRRSSSGSSSSATCSTKRWT
jgi:signal transduction histidine kinase